MIPTTEVGSSVQNPFLFYVSMLGILLVIGTWLRLKVPFLKRYFIPASLIAGIIGLLLGPQFLCLSRLHFLCRRASTSFSAVLLKKAGPAGTARHPV